MRVRRARDEAEHAAAEALVESVFGGEQGVPADAIERPVPRAVRLAALADGGELVGTCRVVLDGGVARLGSLVVAAPARRRGVATALVAAAEREARGDGARIMRLHAQIDARPLYDAAGYAPVGAPFREQGIDHLTMEKIL
ncbi:MAG TPA: GNAT family N-acetyltransferase [Solirubrobacteraceae bacterium]